MPGCEVLRWPTPFIGCAARNSPGLGLALFMLKLTARSAFSSSLFLLVLALPSCGGGGGGGSGSGGGGGGGGAGVVPSTPVSIDHSGVLAAAAGNAAVRLHLRRPPSGFESAVFHATTSAGLLAGTQVAVSGDALTPS